MPKRIPRDAVDRALREMERRRGQVPSVDDLVAFYDVPYRAVALGEDVPESEWDRYCWVRAYLRWVQFGPLPWEDDPRVVAARDRWLRWVEEVGSVAPYFEAEEEA